ncbi:hypothetical protein [Halorubrum sp. Atlit-26R]|uniref:hypothetical protein n=1 Tax=Halorubrum sp. Atlit-26R TaxID=2282128 RepID=UPI0011C378D8|nr:hypothetical protein [Halorubrum sp. Atlit-26R]
MSMRVRDMVKGAFLLNVLSVATGVVAFILFALAGSVVDLPASAANPIVWAVPAGLVVFGAYSKLGN